MYTIKRNIKKITIALIIIIIISLTGVKYYLDTHKEDDIVEEEKIIEIKPQKEEEIITDKIYVDIKGAVKIPGVYELEKNSRTNKLIEKAGGITEEADTTYINLAKKLQDEMVIIIYTKDQIKKAKEKETLAPKEINNTCICPKITNDVCIAKENITQKTETKTEETKTNKININTASEEELQTLTGIGASKAKAIIEYREQNGPFNKTEDITNVSGIGESAYEKIKDNITV